MANEYVFARVSGPSLEDCNAIIYRYDADLGFQWDEVDSFVYQRLGDVVSIQLHQRAWWADVWRSPSGTAFVASGEGEVLRVLTAPMADGGYVVIDELPASIFGVWGLDDRTVWAWGETPDEGVLFRWDGARWQREDLEGFVLGVHGSAPDLVYAVGQGGLIARWDGVRWSRVPSPTSRVLSSVFVASADEMYAVGASGAVLQGSVYGWSELFVSELQFGSVAKRGDTVWVGAGHDGLHHLVGNALVPADGRYGGALDARGNLVVAALGELAQTADGRTFESVLMSDVRPLVDARAP